MSFQLKTVIGKICKLNRSALIFAIAGTLTLVWALTSNPKPATRENTVEPTSVDTYIPRGFVLVPIDISNFEALDSILGKTGVVDLFAPGKHPESPGRRIARHLKIMRAPLNPSRFAVLATEDQAPELVRFQTPFYAVVQNPNQTGPEIEKHQKQVSRITIGDR